MSDAIVVKQSTELVNWEERLAQDARDQAAKVKVVTPSISIQGGVIQIGGNPVANNTLQAVILDQVYLKGWYEGQFNPDDKKPPSCWAMSEDGENMVPHENCKGLPLKASPGEYGKPSSCAACPKNKWGSSPTSKRGKACKDGIRIVVMAASDLSSPDVIRQAEVYKLKISPTGLKGFGMFLKGIRDNFARPSWAMVTEIGVVRVKTYFHLTFKPINVVDATMLGALVAKKDAVHDQLWEEYSVEEADAEAVEDNGKF